MQLPWLLGKCLVDFSSEDSWLRWRLLKVSVVGYRRGRRERAQIRRVPIDAIALVASRLLQYAELLE